MKKPGFLTDLVNSFGWPRIVGALLLAIALGYLLGWPRVKAWYYEGKAERMQVQRDTARAAEKVARRDEAQVTRAAETTAKTVEAQDKHAARIQADTTRATEVIDERIRQAPAAAVVPDDPVVRREAYEAYRRAQAAQDRLQGAPSGDR